jgi:formylmethanofuran dehydrogenase subunit E
LAIILLMASEVHYNCNECGEKFSSQSEVDNHKRTVHKSA